MAEQFEIPRVKLGTQGLEVSKLGYGCMGLTGIYNNPVPEEEGIAIIKEAFCKGITFFDTSDIYGANNANEYLVGKALKQLPREKIELATKFGIVGGHARIIKGTPEYARSCCESSLKRLGVDYIDLYYIHRIDQTVPIEETMGELKKLVNEGKIKYIGLSEASPDTIRRAHAIHPITAIQMEYSLWTRNIEEEFIPLCRELGIGIVPYSPVGRGFFAGKAVVESVPQNSSLEHHPRFTGENFDRNKAIYFRIEKLAKKHGCTPAQLTVAWVLHQGDDVVPIPAPRLSIKHIGWALTRSAKEVCLTYHLGIHLKVIFQASAVGQGPLGHHWALAGGSLYLSLGPESTKIIILFWKIFYMGGIDNGLNDGRGPPVFRLHGQK